MNDSCRRPVAGWEVPLLVRLGTCLRELRTQAGLSQRELAAKAGLAERSVRRIEHGHRRTRASTLQRLAEVLVGDAPRHGSADDVLDQLLSAAGSGLAEESEYRWRVDARRRRREAKQGKRVVTEHILVGITRLPDGGVLEQHLHRRWVTRRKVREREYTVFRRPGDHWC